MKALIASVLICVTSFAGLRAESLTITIAGATYATQPPGKDLHGSTSATLTLPPGSNIFDALAYAGGCSNAAYLTGIKITRPTEDATRTTWVIDVTPMLKTPDTAFPLKDGDIIYVPVILEPYPPPHYFNRLLFEWAFRKSTRQPLPETWDAMVAQMTSRGAEKRLPLKQPAPPLP